MKDNRLERLIKMLRQVGACSNDFTSSESLESIDSSPNEDTLDVGFMKSISGQSEIVTESLDLLVQDRAKDIDTESQDALEAIVMPYYRPVIDIINGQMVTTQLSRKWRHLGTTRFRNVIESTLKSIGRIEIPNHPSLPYAGTGFVVGKSSKNRGILMTNRHVAEIFSTGLGVRNLQFRTGQTVSVDFLREYGRDNTSDSLTVERVLMIHPYWDMALLQVIGLADGRKPLNLSVVNPEN